MADDTLDMADRIAMILGGGLVVVGIIVFEFIETLVSPHTLDRTSTLNDVIVHPAINPTFRASLIALGLAVWSSLPSIAWPPSEQEFPPVGSRRVWIELRPFRGVDSIEPGGGPRKPLSRVPT